MTLLGTVILLWCVSVGFYWLGFTDGCGIVGALAAFLTWVLLIRSVVRWLGRQWHGHGRG